MTTNASDIEYVIYMIYFFNFLLYAGLILFVVKINRKINEHDIIFEEKNMYVKEHINKQIVKLMDKHTNKINSEIDINIKKYIKEFIDNKQLNVEIKKEINDINIYIDKKIELLNTKYNDIDELLNTKYNDINNDINKIKKIIEDLNNNSNSIKSIKKMVDAINNNLANNSVDTIVENKISVLNKDYKNLYKSYIETQNNINNLSGDVYIKFTNINNTLNYQANILNTHAASIQTINNMIVIEIDSVKEYINRINKYVSKSISFINSRLKYIPNKKLMDTDTDIDTNT